MFLKFPLAYIFCTYEDLLGEWAQFYSFAITFLLAVRQVLVSRRFRMFFIILALACFYVAGEEISWGQRILELSTPVYLSKYNLQNEMNLHNIFVGPLNTLLKQVLIYVIALAVVIYGVLFPWLLRIKWGIALWVDKKGLAAPPLYLSPFFAAASFFELELFRFNDAEIAELLIPIALALMILNYWVSHRSQVAVHQQKEWGRAESMYAAKATIFLIACILSLSTITTIAVSSSPRIEQKIQQRYWGGVEAFARRYANISQWQVASELYLNIAEREPHRPSVRRNLYRCYAQMGMNEKADLQLNKAIEMDLLRLKKNKFSITAHISIAQDYKLQNNTEKEQQHLERALDIGLKTKEKYPNDANTAYWLGKTYIAQGDFPNAVSELRRVSILKPNTLKFRQTLLYAQSQLQDN